MAQATARRRNSRINDKRGNSTSRKVRKAKLLVRHGNGITCPCSWCGVEIDSTSLQQDRIVPGGSYSMPNLIPACADCNRERSDTSFISYLARCKRADIAVLARNVAQDTVPKVA